MTRVEQSPSIATTAPPVQSDANADRDAAWQWATPGEKICPATCPNCGDDGAKDVLLRVPLADAAAPTALLRCVACGCGFFDPAWKADYRAEPSSGPAALTFYLQQGAGLRGITQNLAELGLPRGTRLLEVGCGFGFGLDFARRILGWEVLGLDPSPQAAAGRRSLDLPIEPHYLTIDDPELRGRFDVVMASEVIEHVPSPPAFARTLLNALRDGGSLVLTTPDVEAVRRETPDGLLLPLLSIGFHLVLQSADSLGALLRAAGFEAVEVRSIGGASLLARARRPGGTKLAAEGGGQAPEVLYRHYLTAAAEAVTPDQDLWFGLVARAYREAVNAADAAAADRHWAALAGACQRRYGFDIEAASAESGIAQPLDVLAAREPICLGPLLFHRTMHRLLTGASRRSVEHLLVRAEAACRRLRDSLRLAGVDDGDAEAIAWVAAAERLLCAAERGAKDVAAAFAALGPAPADRAAGRKAQEGRLAHFQRRAYVSLVNAGQLEVAGQLESAVKATEAKAADGTALLDDDELDVLFCAAVRECQRADRSPGRALGLLRLLQAASGSARAAGRRTGSAVTLVKPALDVEILALELLGRSQEARALRAQQKRAKPTDAEPGVAPRAG